MQTHGHSSCKKHMLSFTYWQLHKCVTRISICKQPPHEKSGEAGSVRKDLPWCLVKPEKRRPLQAHHHNKMKVIHSVLNQIKLTNLSIKLGFISRLYIVKSRRGILFNKMSPTRPVRTQIKIGLYTTHWVLEWFNSMQSQWTAYWVSITFMLFIKVSSLVNSSTIFHQQTQGTPALQGLIAFMLCKF